MKKADIQILASAMRSGLVSSEELCKYGVIDLCPERKIERADIMNDDASHAEIDHIIIRRFVSND